MTLPRSAAELPGVGLNAVVRQLSAGLLCQLPAIEPQWCRLINQRRNPIQQSIRH